MTRLWHWLSKSEVTLKELGIKAEAGADPVKAGGDLKLELKMAPSFRQKLCSTLSGRIGELRKEVCEFFEDGFKAIQSSAGRATRVVFLFDSLEQLRGSLMNETDVMHSVQVLFSNHLSLLRIPYLHLVYTVPPWLKFILPGSDVVVLPCVRLWQNDSERSTCPPGVESLRGVLAKRFTESGMRRFFGAESQQVDRLIRLCGGHFRDLLLLARETVLRAREFPVSDDVLEAAIIRVRGNFLPIAVEEARWLTQIDQERTTLMKNRSSEEVALLTRFLDSHVLLYLKNGDEWYDVHPLIRDEVWEIVKSDDRVRQKARE